jgi:hypothetical protein
VRQRELPLNYIALTRYFILKARVAIAGKWNRIAIAYYYENYIIQTFKLVFHAKSSASFLHFIKVI